MTHTLLRRRLRAGLALLAVTVPMAVAAIPPAPALF